MKTTGARPKRVLVFPCGSEIGLEIHRSLAHATHFELVGASSVDDHGSFVYSDYVGGLPTVHDDAFPSALVEVAAREHIDLVFPAHDDVTVAVARLAADGRLPADAVGSPLPTTEVARSKRRTYAALGGSVAVPSLFGSPESLDDRSFPVFVKPDCGQGSRGARRVDDIDELRRCLAGDPSLVVQEHLPGPEYTVDCFTDRHGRLRYAAGRLRSRISNGISVRTVGVDDQRFAEIAAAINGSLQLRGVWFFQLKERSSGELVLMELATRVAGTMGWSRCRGVNLPLLTLFDRLGCDIEIEHNEVVLEVDRALGNVYRSGLRYEQVYLDFDDLLVHGGRLNVAVVAFVYQCRNRGIPVRLVTRHRGDLPARLRDLAIADCFAEVIWLQAGERKADFITLPNAIFIDDSHAERASVREALGIPVFDAHMIESLLDLR